MCMNCGCGEPNERHHPTDITKEDLQRAADCAGMTLEDAARNLQKSAGEVGSGSSGQGSSQSA